MNVFVGYISALRYWHDTGRRFEGAHRSAVCGVPRTAASWRELRVPAWLFGEEPVDVIVSDAEQRARNERYRFHVCSVSLPREAWCDMGGGLFVASPELCFVHMAGTLSCAGLLLLGLELCGTYRLDAEGGFRGGCEPLTSAAELRRFARAAQGVPGHRAALRASRWVVDGSASPMESALFARLCLSGMLGGYACPLPAMNREILLSDAQQSMSGKLYLRGDLFWPACNVLVEYDGEAWHCGREKMAQDSMRDNAVMAKGIAKFTVTADVYNEFSAFDALANELRVVLGKRPLAASRESRWLRKSLAAELRDQELLIRA